MTPKRMPDPDMRDSGSDGQGRLAENVVHFARLLRRAGLRVGPGQIVVALQALTCGCLRRREDFRTALAAVFVTSHEQRPLFDQAFDAFWRRSKPLEEVMARLMQMSQPPGARPRPAASRRLAEAMFDGMEHDAGGRAPDTIELDARFTASPFEVLRHRDFEQMSTEEQREARAAIAKLRLARLEQPTRRFRPAKPRGTLDARRTLRRSLRSGSDFIDFAWRERATREPPLVVLCDISGSMAGYTRMFLHFLHALMTRRRGVHVFLFGTRLTNVTRALARRDVDEALQRAAQSVQDWSGGTRIGQSLRAFNYDWARRVLGQGAHVLLITDGLERDSVDLLGEEMARLKRQAKRVVWLNPLLRYSGFAALASGVRAMLPHVDEFRPVHTLASLEELADSLAHPPARAHDPRRFLAASG